MNVDLRRVHVLRQAELRENPVVYWMQRDQRSDDNWALIYAQETAVSLQQPLLVVFTLVPSFNHATLRQYAFMLKGLEQLSKRLKRHNIPFFLLNGLPQDVLPRFLVEAEAGLLITDFNPLTVCKSWKQRLNERITIPFHEVDAHNIIPCRYISDHQEYAAFTLRKKVEKLLSEFLTPIPGLVKHPFSDDTFKATNFHWSDMVRILMVDHKVGEVDWIQPGESAAHEGLESFIRDRLEQYETDRNFPGQKGQSNLSPWLHFGHISAQRVALEVQSCQANSDSRHAFLEELIVRRELADNFCHYNKDYADFEGFQPWAKATLTKHRDDPREYLYTAEQFDQAQTHDALWNAAQLEMVITGKMHGFMRMYWAKKILEWTPSPEEAMAVAIALNDRYELDGRDPNGYAGVAWSIGGTHDRPWGERQVFGMIRYMNYQGCRRKFDVERYVRGVTRDA